MTTGTPGVPVIVLAAGDASRFGSPKQLAPWHGTSLIRHAAKTALDAGVGPVVVVLGSCAEQLRAELMDLPVVVHEHRAWADGIGSTIAAGLIEQRRRWPDSKAVILMACDQPRVTGAHLAALVTKHREAGCDAVASAYARTIGIPALFDTRVRELLENLQGDRGAKPLLESVRTESIPLPGGELDVDRPQDLRRGE